MWRPSEVVPEHRKWAVLIWTCLILAIIGYTAWQIVDVLDDYSDPSTSFELSNDLYKFPVVTVCVDLGTGCSFADNSTSGCVTSALKYSSASFLNKTVNATKSEQNDNCIKFDLSKLNVGEGEKVKRTSALIEMDWISSNNASIEEEYISSVVVLLGDVGGHREDMLVPYSRNVYPTNSATYGFTELTIGKTDRVLLSGTTVETYAVQTTSTTTMVTSRASGLPSLLGKYLKSSTQSSNNSLLSTINLADRVSVGTLFLAITQGSYAYITVTDVNPLELGTILGNIGGFWELLVIAWGFCFMRTLGNQPRRKARNFNMSFRRGSSKTMPPRQRSHPSRNYSSRTAGVDWDGTVRRPSWSSADLSRTAEIEEGRQKRLRDQRDNGATDDSVIAAGENENDSEGGETEPNSETRRSLPTLPRVLSRGRSFRGIGGSRGSSRGSGSGGSFRDSGSSGSVGGGEASSRSDGRGGVGLRARSSFFSPRRPISMSFKRSLQQTPGSASASVTEEEIARCDPFNSSYADSSRDSSADNDNDDGEAGDVKVDISVASEKWEMSTENSSVAVAV